MKAAVAQLLITIIFISVVFGLIVLPIWLKALELGGR